MKIGALRVLAMRFGIARGQAWLFAFLLSQGGEFAFVVFGPGVAGDVLGAETAATLTWWWPCRWRPRRCCCCSTTRSWRRA